MEVLSHVLLHTVVNKQQPEKLLNIKGLQCDFTVNQGKYSGGLNNEHWNSESIRKLNISVGFWDLTI